ncbi:hypothetical protein BC827DRAFT_1124223, partial [Russula dissimulans]
NIIELANETKVTARLGGYQYVSTETVEPSNDRSLDRWADCPVITMTLGHVKKFYESPEFKAAAKSAEPFFYVAKDFVFGDRPLTLENIVSNPWNDCGLAC